MARKKLKSLTQKRVEKTLGSAGWDQLGLRVLFNPVDPWEFFPDRYLSRVEKLRGSWVDCPDPYSRVSFQDKIPESILQKFQVLQTNGVIYSRRWNLEQTVAMTTWLKKAGPTYASVQLRSLEESTTPLPEGWIELEILQAMSKEKLKF